MQWNGFFNDMVSFMLVYNVLLNDISSRLEVAYLILFLKWSDIRSDIIIKTDVTQALLMLILSKSPSHVLKRA